MKPTYRSAVSVAAMGLLLLAPLAFAQSDPTATFLSQTKITEADARATALTKVPNGTVKSSNLEKEHGVLIWSFDVSQPTTKNVTEVQVDAKSGKIISVKKETPAQEAKEAKEAKSANHTGK